MTTRRRYRCRYCGLLFNAWLLWAKAPSGVLLFGHVSQHHADQMAPYLRRIEASEDIDTVAAEAYEVIDVVEEDGHQDIRNRK
jgi:hypothetical protein